MIDRQTVEKILDAADIVDVVSDYVALKKEVPTGWVYAHFTTTESHHSMLPAQKGSANALAVEKEAAQ